MCRCSFWELLLISVLLCRLEVPRRLLVPGRFFLSFRRHVLVSIPTFYQFKVIGRSACFFLSFGYREVQPHLVTLSLFPCALRVQLLMGSVVWGPFVPYLTGVPGVGSDSNSVSRFASGVVHRTLTQWHAGLVSLK